MCVHAHGNTHTHIDTHTQHTHTHTQHTHTHTPHTHTQHTHTHTQHTHTHTQHTHSTQPMSSAEAVANYALQVGVTLFNEANKKQENERNLTSKQQREAQLYGCIQRMKIIMKNDVLYQYYDALCGKGECLCEWLSVCVCMCVCVCVCECVCVYACVCVYVCMCICTYIYVCVYATHPLTSSDCFNCLSLCVVFARVCMPMCVCVCVCVCMCVCVFIQATIGWNQKQRLSLPNCQSFFLTHTKVISHRSFLLRSHCVKSVPCFISMRKVRMHAIEMWQRMSGWATELMNEWMNERERNERMNETFLTSNEWTKSNATINNQNITLCNWTLTTYVCMQ